MERRNGTAFPLGFLKQNAIPKRAEKKMVPLSRHHLLLPQVQKIRSLLTTPRVRLRIPHLQNSIYDFTTTASRRRNVKRRSAPKPTSFLPVA
jgi:hypothetical protein